MQVEERSGHISPSAERFMLSLRESSNQNKKIYWGAFLKKMYRALPRDFGEVEKQIIDFSQKCFIFIVQAFFVLCCAVFIVAWMNHEHFESKIEEFKALGPEYSELYDAYAVELSFRYEKATERLIEQRQSVEAGENSQTPPALISSFEQVKILDEISDSRGMNDDPYVQSLKTLILTR